MSQSSIKWVEAYKTNSQSHAVIIAGMLEENGIANQILNKQDSMYNIALPGDSIIMVPETHLEKAVALIGASDNINS